ncbi:MAG TPA: methyltransferase domain-containing protein, partial [Methylomirabilota bacterium]|nr:methyltransferase domain-containing protein [Methylomirabilota bacterium]
RSSAPRRAGEGAAAVEAQEGGGRRVWTEAPRPAPIEWRFGGSFAENYERYLVPAIFGPWARDLLDLAIPKPGERLLDVACGSGIAARLAAERVGPTGSVVGVDIDPAMLVVARKAFGAAKIDWRQADATALPLEDRSFDVVICQEGLQYIADRAAALREMHRVLVPRGRLAVSCWRPIEYSPGFLALAEVLAEHAGAEAAALAAAPFAFWDVGGLRAVILRAGFEIVSTFDAVRTLHFPSCEEFVRRYGTGSPLADVLARMSADSLARLIGGLEARLAPYIGAEELAFPIEAHVALAHT